MSCSASSPDGQKVIYSTSQVATTTTTTTTAAKPKKAAAWPQPASTIPGAMCRTSEAGLVSTACSSTSRATAAPTPIPQASQPTIVTKTTPILTKTSTSQAPQTYGAPAPPQVRTNVVSQVSLSEVPFSTSQVVKTAAWRSRSTRSASPKRNYTPRRNRQALSVSAATASTEAVRSTYTYRLAAAPAAKPATATAAPIRLSSASKTSARDASGSITYRKGSAPEGRSSSPGQVVECRAVFMHQSRSWKFSLSGDSAVNDAVSTATQQVLRNVVEKDERIGDRLSISTLPAVADNSTVAEWSHRNLDQPPMIVIMSEVEDGLAQQKPEFDAQNMQRLMEEQTNLLSALQKQLEEQTAIIRNQATYISELQARDKQQSTQLTDAVQRIQVDIAQMKGQLLSLEENATQVGDENRSGKKDKSKT